MSESPPPSGTNGGATTGRSESARFEDSPLTRPEYVAALVHLYRGEVGRSTSWRMRLDITTNWAILTVTALVTFSFGEREHSHAAILVGMGLVYTFMAIEARRYRYFDVWQHRVRLLERNFYVPLLRRDLQSPTTHWARLIGDDLMSPRFRLSKWQAIRSRLVRNYMYLFVILLATWLMKLLLHGSDDWGAPAWQRMSVGSLPGWVALALVVCLYGHLGWLWIRVEKHPPAEEAYGEKPGGPAGLIDL